MSDTSSLSSLKIQTQSGLDGHGRSLAITAMGHAFPRSRASNEQLAAELDLDTEWIRQRCGIDSRFVSSSDETTVSLGSTAAAQALEKSSIIPDLLICSTCTPSLAYCPIAPSIASNVGLGGIGAFDINAACSGGIVGLITAAGYLLSGCASCVLLVCSDTMTKHLSRIDHSTRILFGDGAAALLVQRGAQTGFQMLSWIMGSDGGGASWFGAAASCSRTNKYSPVQMDGRQMFRFATERGVLLINELCDRANVSMAQISRVVVHQANARITAALQRSLPIPKDRWAESLKERGNTTSASAPLCLIDCLRGDSLRNGDLVLVAAFGAGLTWAGILLQRRSESNNQIAH
jgi:3-oxoacyl-[acyl-carrier-protein] synthase III